MGLSTASRSSGVRVGLPAWLAAALLAGCLPSFERFVVGERDAGSLDDASADVDASRVDGGPGRPDAGGRDVGTEDVGPGPGDACGLPPTCGDGCPLPWLLASVEQLDTTAPCPGRIHRWSLRDRTRACVCAGLSGRGQLRQPTSVGFVPPNLVVVGEADGAVRAIDATNDQIVWTGMVEGRPLDVVPLEDSAGTPMVAVATQASISAEVLVGRVSTFIASSGAAGPTWMRNSTQLPTGVTSVTLVPGTPGRLRFARPDHDQAALDVDPWVGVSGVYLGPELPQLFTISSSFTHYQTRPSYRTVWTVRRTATDRRAVMNLRRPSADPPESRIGIAATCDEGADRRPYPHADAMHAVPSPFWDTDSFVLVELEPAVRRIVRLEHTEHRCTDLLDGAGLVGRGRLSRLALAHPTPWGP